MDTDETPTLEYTQHSVAWPQMPADVSRHWVKDELSLSLAYPDGGTAGEIHWTFCEFTSSARGVQMCVFGDGLRCLYDPRVQEAVAFWRSLSKPDDVTPAEMVEILRRAGAVPSRYHSAGLTRKD